MNTIREVGIEFEKTHKRMAELANSLSELRENYQRAKALYENSFSRHLLEIKAREPEWTVQEVKAQATNLAYDDRLLCIKAESAYKRVVNEMKMLDTYLEGLKEHSYNLRQELKNLGSN